MTSSLHQSQRRTHSVEFKAELVARCSQAGVSVSAVALAHGVNANLLRKWIKRFSTGATLPASPALARLVPIQVETTHPLHNRDIHLDIQRGTARINIRWPVTEAAACAQWLGTWLK